MNQRNKAWSAALAAVAAALLSTPSVPTKADTPDQIGQLQIVQPWVERASAGGTARLKLKIVNDGPDDLHVVKMTSPIAAKVRFVLAEAAGQRVPLSSITVLAHDSVDLETSILRLTLEGLTHDLQIGERFPLTFHLAPYGIFTTTVTVRDPAQGGAS